MRDYGADLALWSLVAAVWSVHLGFALWGAAMAIVVGLAVGLIVAGLVIIWLSGNARQPVLVSVFWWVGLALAVVGLILLLAPVVAWIDQQLRSMLRL